jgi:membrane-associated protein
MFEHLISSLSLFSAVPGLDIIDFITGLGIFAILFVIFAESGLLIGFFLPGDSLLFTAGILVQSGILQINIHLFVFLLFLAAVLGDNVGYAFGRRVGPRLFSRPSSRIFKQEYIAKAQSFYEKHGGKTIIIARFVPIVRTFAPVVAGIGKMHYRTFFLYNIVGGALWTAGITYLGFFLGSLFERAGVDVDTVILPIIAIIILASVLPPVIHILKVKENRDSLRALIKKQLDFILKRP